MTTTTDANPAALLEDVFSHQRNAEQLLDQACEAAGARAYASGCESDEQACYRRAAAELRSRVWP